MNLLRLLALFLCLVTPALFARGAEMLWTTSEINVESSFKWTGIWAVPASETNAASAQNPMETPPPDLLGAPGTPGPWTGTMVVSKTLNGGNATYRMTMTGKHKPTGPEVVLFHTFASTDLRTKDVPDSKSHGADKDDWNLYVDPSNPERIIWVVTANHIPEPAASTALAAAGLLAFGAAWRLRARRHAAGNAPEAFSGPAVQGRSSP